MNDLVTLVLGTAAMLFMVVAIISFAFFFQRKFLRKQKEFNEIETLLKRQELKSAYLLIEGQDQERKRIAADLHDNIGSILATLKIYSDLTLSRQHVDDHERLNTKVNELVEKLGIEIRKISHSLDSGALMHFGLDAGIAQLCEAIESSGKLKVNFINDFDGTLGHEVALHIYRVIQELFTNTLKHARASSVRLEVTRIKDEISIIYEDDGEGFDLTKVGVNSMGLNTIRSRIQKVNGEVKIQSNARGSTFIFEIPLRDSQV